MSEEALNRPVDGSGSDSPQTEPMPTAPVTARQKEAVLRALSGLDAMKRKGEPEVARKIVSRHLDRHTSNRSMPALIARFLDRHWQSYMTQLYIGEGEQSEAWSNALENTENLTWSLQPKCDDGSRQRLYVLLPDLFQWIHAVLRSQQVAVSEEDAFFAELARLQVAALHANANADTGAPSGAAPESVAGGGNTAAQRQVGAAGIAGGTKAVDPLHSNAGSGPAAKEKGVESNPLQGLVIGKAVEFLSDRATKRVMRLEWISRGGGVYLFRDQRRGDALCLTADRCIQCLRERSFSLLN